MRTIVEIELKWGYAIKVSTISLTRHTHKTTKAYLHTMYFISKNPFDQFYCHHILSYNYFCKRESFPRIRYLMLPKHDKIWSKQNPPQEIIISP